MYDSYYREALEIVRPYLAQLREPRRPAAATGSIATTTRTTRCGRRSLPTLNLADGTSHDVWSVNTEADYLEEGEMVDGLLDLELTPQLALDVQR